MFITTKKILVFCGCLIFVGGVVFYFYQQHQPDPEPVKIYNLPKLGSKQDSPVKASPIETARANVTPIDDAHTGHDHPLHEQSPDTPEISASTVTDVAAPEKKDDVLSEKVIQKWVTDTMALLDQVNVRLVEKHPELFEISQMTREQFFEKYSTPEAQKVLLEYIQRVRPEISKELRAVFSNIPIEIADDILLEAKDHFVKMWGQEAADQVVHQLRTELGL